MKGHLNGILKYLNSESCNNETRYPRARMITLEEEEIKERPLESSLKDWQGEWDLVRVDMMAQDVAYIQVEGAANGRYRRQVRGLLRSGGEWQVAVAMEAWTDRCFESLYDGDFHRQYEDMSELTRLLLDYCHTVHRMDADGCLKLFWPGTRMYHPDGAGSFVDVPIQVLHDRWRDAPDPDGAGFVEFSRVYHIEMLDRNTAIAKIGCAKLETSFQDYLFCIRQGGAWRIVNKITKGLHVGRPRI